MKRLLRDLSIFIAVLFIAGLCPISVIYVLFIDCGILPDVKLATVDLGEDNYRLGSTDVSLKHIVDVDL